MNIARLPGALLITAAMTQCSSFAADTNSLAPSVQAAVSNILSRLTNDEAKAAFKAKLAAEFPQPVLLPLREFTGWSTNGPAVYAGTRLAITNYNNNPIFNELHRLGYPTPPRERLDYYTNNVFDHFLAESLNHLCWTNFIAHTNGRTTRIWSISSHADGWPGKPPLAHWDTKGLTWGMTGLTAISPCWQYEGLPGQIPITALTRRHGYTRGHDVGPQGFQKRWAGAKVWFLTLDNRIIETTIVREVVRTLPVDHRDYSLVLFSDDLPDSITPIRVTSYTTWLAKCPVRPGAPALTFLTEQSGNVSAEVPGFTVPTMKGGDSGSPNMLPMPQELVFYSGRTTSGPSPEMQADMDELCRSSGLDPARYQMKWVDLSAFPSY